MARDATLFVRSLTVEERHTLQDLYHRTPDALLKSRCHILLLSADGHRVPQIAQLLYYSMDTVARCIHDFNQQGSGGILPQPGGGRPPKVTPDYLERLFQAVDADPRNLG
jgi:transposase